jgi:long-chain fatty acid transport protein
VTTIRLGAFYDQTPVQDGYVAPELPDNDKIGLTCGASFKFTDRLSMDMSILYENVPARTQTNKETGLSGTFKTTVFAPGIGINYLLHKKKSNQ